MPRITSTVIVVVAVLAFGTGICRAEDQAANRTDEKRHAKAEQVARAFFVSLTQGDTAVTTALSDVPFALDRKRTIESISELEKLFETVVEEKGRRDIKPTEIKVVADENEIQEDAFPADYIMVLLIIGDEEGVTLCVRPGDTFRVVGLSD
jgi:hypothetical protein